MGDDGLLDRARGHPAREARDRLAAVEDHDGRELEDVVPSGDGRLVVSSTRARIEQALGDGGEADTMGDVQEYLDNLGQLPEATITLWVDQRAIAEASRAAMEADTAGAKAQAGDAERMAAAATALEEYNVVRDFGVGIFWSDAGIRSDVFTRFLEPADVEPAQVRTSELTVMMMQLVASGRGVCCLPNWALHEYSSRGYVTAKRLGEKGLYCTLYAAIRADMLDAPFMRDFLLTAKDTSFATLEGVSAAR